MKSIFFVFNLLFAPCVFGQSDSAFHVPILCHKAMHFEMDSQYGGLFSAYYEAEKRNAIWEQKNFSFTEYNSFVIRGEINGADMRTFNTIANCPFPFNGYDRIPLSYQEGLDIDLSDACLTDISTQNTPWDGHFNKDRQHGLYWGGSMVRQLRLPKNTKELWDMRGFPFLQVLDLGDSIQTIHCSDDVLFQYNFFLKHLICRSLTPPAIEYTSTPQGAGFQDYFYGRFGDLIINNVWRRNGWTPIHIQSDEPEYSYITSWFCGPSLENHTLWVPKESIALYQSTLPWSLWPQIKAYEDWEYWQENTKDQCSEEPICTDSIWSMPQTTYPSYECDINSIAELKGAGSGTIVLTGELTRSNIYSLINFLSKEEGTFCLDLSKVTWGFVDYDSYQSMLYQYIPCNVNCLVLPQSNQLSIKKVDYRGGLYEAPGYTKARSLAISAQVTAQLGLNNVHTLDIGEVESIQSEQIPIFEESLKNLICHSKVPPTIMIPDIPNWEKLPFDSVFSKVTNDYLVGAGRKSLPTMENHTLWVPKESVALYRSTFPWSLWPMILPIEELASWQTNGCILLEQRNCHDGNLYDISGRKLSHILHKHIYIKNNKKIIVSAE